MSDKCDCGHDHDHEHDHENEIVTITLDGDTEVDCNVLGVFDVEGKEYIALLPIEDEEVLIYKYSEGTDGVKLDLIESDEEFEEVSKVFYDLFLEDEEDDDDFDDDDLYEDDDDDDLEEEE